MDNIYYNKKYNVTQNYLDKNDRINALGILDIFQDIAGKHANVINLGFNNLVEHGYFWVLSKNRFRVLKDLKGLTDFNVKTYQTEVSFASYNRDFFVSDEKGELLIIGDSRWCVLDRKSMKIVPSKIVGGTNDVGSPKAFNEKFIRIEKLESFDYQMVYKVVYCDLDHNGHMNNTKYVNQIINYLKDEIIKFIEIEYISQCYLDDELHYVFKKIDENKYVINIYNKTKDVLASKCFVEAEKYE